MNDKVYEEFADDRAYRDDAWREELAHALPRPGEDDEVYPLDRGEGVRATTPPTKHKPALPTTNKRGNDNDSI